MGRFLAHSALIALVACVAFAGRATYRAWTDDGSVVQRLRIAPHDPYGTNVTAQIADLLPIGMSSSELWRTMGENRFRCVGSMFAGPYLVVCDRAGSPASLFCPRYWRIEFLFDRRGEGAGPLNRFEATAREDC